MPATPPNRLGLTASGLLALCRAGFEKEVAAELDDFAASIGLMGFVRTRPGSAFATFETHEPVAFADLAERCDWRTLIFARQLLPWFARVDDLPERDRATPIAAATRNAGQRFAQLMLETPDTDEAKQQSGFCRRFAVPLQHELERIGAFREGAKGLPELHILFPDTSTAWLCAALPGQAALWPMGIPRLRMLREAASRSTLKLAEAIFTLLTEAERSASLRAGLRAVDLGAAPGGWTWQLAHRGLRVTAVDNGPMAPSVMATEMVEHVRADGFTWRPPRPVEWMVCDMVEQPARIAALVADWIATGRCRRTIFNLKLPMKKRIEAVEQCRALITKRLAQAGPFELRFKHLYHDREEITGYLALRAAAV
ncbi:23S rRNA (cytidine(2498)-2'-O)-methyltransferase RlmM [Aromatoleum bremense]|uniref:Ribosomal RNA large subunit methyltransferase M n=1 Tax=Aromatoleum bremense TaxID=76115 RepID=A0ABX1NVE8_9RHOO|nr:23S rRNA (cytidine(2498)-2'-O)-methyltransferase RlmM [Aromatoleum bremense]NMG15616.1 23S rRNA (cytidine(2498)-2'-O)-methyltransferase RlmM [Aromatoleum bremense]QTQ32860.1 Ribosomal RNA large subunit methyltransferase M [Aromatoleum bremense]